MKNDTPTSSVCSVCLKTIPAVKRVDGNDVWLEKNCPEHGPQRFRIAKDAVRFFDTTFAVDGKPVYEHQRAVEKGCPDDCGLCPEHRQHLCTGLIEITDRCNLGCPICYADAASRTGDISVSEFSFRLDTLLRTEGGKLDVLQISGGEPTLHPEFAQILDVAASKEIGRILVNTNGLRLLDDDGPILELEKHRDRAEAYLQFDGFDDDVYKKLRGVPLAEQKRKIVERLDSRGIKMSLTVTLCKANLKEIPAILDLACHVESITGVTFQRLTKVGRAKQLNEPTVLQEDILHGIGQSGKMQYKDLIPLPCSHVNCTSIGFLFRTADGKVYTLSDYVDFAKCKDVLSNRIAFDRTILDYMQKNVCCCFVSKIFGDSVLLDRLREFAEGNGSSHRGMKVLRILVKNFMDAETFDAERAKQCCIGVSVGGDRIVPFCVHNMLQQ